MSGTSFSFVAMNPHEDSGSWVTSTSKKDIGFLFCVVASVMFNFFAIKEHVYLQTMSLGVLLSIASWSVIFWEGEESLTLNPNTSAS
jgi:hypothetical protein